MPKLNPKAYIKRYDETEKEKQRRLGIAKQAMDDKKNIAPKSGRKTKKQREVEERMKDQASFLLFLEKEKKEEATTNKDESN
jgi:hypothetical protein